MDRKDLSSQENSPVPPELVKFFYLSFRYSQGDADLQESIFKYASILNVFNNVPGKIPSEVLENLHVPKNHTSVGDDGGKQEFADQWEIMSDKIATGWLVNGLYKEKIVSNIFESMVTRDISQITSKRENRLAITRL